MARQVSNRIERIGVMIQRSLAEFIHKEVNDPRLARVSFTQVEVSRDLSHAKVYFSLLAEAEKIEEAAAALNKAAGFLRTLLAKQSDLRTVPQLHFLYDHSLERGRHLSDLIDKARAADQNNAEDT